MKLNSQVTLFSKVSFFDKLLFTKHLGVMLKAGIPISEAIEIIGSQSSNPKFRKMLQNITSEVQNGQTLQKALLEFPHVFDPLYISLIKIGEESGNLEETLSYLAGQLRKTYDFRKKVQGALMYPSIVISAAVIVGGGVSFFVLPKLLDLFQSLDVELPLSTKILLFIASTMKDFGIYIFAGLVVIGFLCKIAIENAYIKPHWHKFLLSLPGIGLFLQNVELATFCRSLGIMLKSGLPIVSALQTQTEATTNLVYKKLYSEIETASEKGLTIETAIIQSKSKFIPPIAYKMIGVGEKTGKLDETLLYLADFFEDEVDTTTKNFSTILEPVMLLVIGLIVAFVAFSIISPIYQLTGSIKAK